MSLGSASSVFSGWSRILHERHFSQSFPITKESKKLDCLNTTLELAIRVYRGSFVLRGVLEGGVCLGKVKIYTFASRWLPRTHVHLLPRHLSSHTKSLIINYRVLLASALKCIFSIPDKYSLVSHVEIGHGRKGAKITTNAIGQDRQASDTKCLIYVRLNKIQLNAILIGWKK